MKQHKSKQGLRILFKRTPKGGNVKHYVKEKPDPASCSRCTGKLQGVPRDIPSVIRAMTRSKRRVNRKFGGVLCGNCVKDFEKYKARMESGYAVKRDLTLEKFLPAGWYGALPKEVQIASKAMGGVDRSKKIVIIADEDIEKPKKAKKVKKDEAKGEEAEVEGANVLKAPKAEGDVATPKEKKPKKKAKKED